MKKFTYFLIILLLISMIGEITFTHAIINQSSQTTNSNKHINYQVNNPLKNTNLNLNQNSYLSNQMTQNKPLTTIYKNSDNSYLSTSKTNSFGNNQVSLSSINLNALQTSVTVFYVNGYIVQGILTDNVGTPVPSTTVYLYLDTVLTYTQVTNSSGGYSFPLSFALADVGSSKNATVYYPSIDGPSYLLAGKVQVVNITVKNKAAITVTKVSPVSNTFGPNTIYTVQATLKTIDSSATDVDPNSASIKVTFTENMVGNSTPFYSTLQSFNSGTASYSKSFGSNQAVSYVITGSIDPVAASLAFPNIIFNPIDCSKSITVTISLDVAFTFNGQIGGTAIIDSTYYYRIGQSLTFVGNLTTGSTGLDLSNHGYTITIYRGPTGTETLVGSTLGVTDSNGGFSYIGPVFDTTNFPNPEDTIKIVATVTSSPGVQLTIVPSTANYTMYIKENVSGFVSQTVNPTLNSSGIIPTTVYYPSSSNTIAISAILHDQNGNLANGVKLKIEVNDHKFPNDTSIVGASYVLTSTIVTDINGYFTYTINVPNTGISSYALTIRISIITDNVWQNPGNVYDEIGTFLYTGTIVTTVQDNTGGSFVNVPSGTSNNINILNNTLDGYFTGGSLFQTTIRDFYGRLPTGLSAIFTMTYINGIGTTVETISVPWTVTSGNNGFQSINLSNYIDSNLNAILNQWGAKVNIVIQIAYNDALITTETYSKTYIIFGPDHAPPVISQIQTNGVYTNNSFYAIPSNVVIGVALGLGGTQQYTNIRNVTIYYRFSTNFVNDENLADFTGVPYSSALMTIVGVGNGETWQYSFAFPGNGQWIQFYIIAYDKAGYGIDQNYNSPGTPYAGYNSAVSNTATSPTYKLVTGDITIDKNIDLNSRVRLNGTLLGSVITLPRFKNVQITLDLIADTSGYKNVTVYWRYLTYDLKGVLTTYTTYSSAPMSFLLSTTINSVNYERYTFTTPNGKTKLDWLVQLDFYFVYFDNSINGATTESTVKVVGNQAQQVTNPSKVIDVTDPTGTQNTANSGFPIAGRNNTALVYQMWSNESVHFIYNITDNGGIGVSNVTLFLYVNGNLDQTVNLLLNGVDLYGGVSGLDAYGSLKNFYYFDYTLSLKNYNGSVVSWTVEAKDGMGNPIIFNPQGSSAEKFNVLAPPVIQPTTGNPTVSTSYYVTTDANGSTYTTYTVITKGLVQGVSNNALIIVLGFILGLLVLILYYQRNNIREVLARRARKKRVESTLKELTEEIMRLGAEGKYHRAIILTWEALERVSREIIQAPRRYNQSAREFALYLSTITIVDRETLLTLSEVYEKARYGRSGVVEEDDFDDAVKALDITVRTIIESGARFRIDEEDEEFE